MNNLAALKNPVVMLNLFQHLIKKIPKQVRDDILYEVVLEALSLKDEG